MTTAEPITGPQAPARTLATAMLLPTDPGPEALRVRPLTQATLYSHGARIAVPSYDRGALTPAVVHLSVGGFSRAHQLIYFDELAERRISTGWGVVGVGLRQRHLQDALAPQDHLYTVVERSPDGERARVVGVMVDYLYAPDAPAAVLDRLSDPRTRLVTLTITPGGYLLDPQTRAFTADHPDVHRDLAEPHAPATVFGYLLEALDRRRQAGLAPFTVVSCDNLHRNGEATRASVVGLARLRDEVLARWITDRVAFPSSMVDRITPQTPPEERAALAARYGVDDRWPVVTEPFSQWFVEDTFSNGRPPLDQVGVRFVPDVGDYELMKTRLLNASHSAMGHLGSLAGYDRMDELMGDPVFATYVERLMDDEVTPLLPQPDGVDLTDYKRTLLQRFANPAIADRLSRLCRRGSAKLPQHLLPSLRQSLVEGRPAPLLLLAVAGWCRYLRGTDDDGRPLPLEDPRADELHALALAGGGDPRPLLDVRAVFGDLGDDPVVVAALTGAIETIDRLGARAAVAAALGVPALPPSR
ncbi:fructuronate reductase [Geodermatophilus poikilotrophus]|uniref:Mannitol-1-phosphate 5-dehydrogenase n=2 Tax=Geodermatophilus poikilotrophus TaxID=1333667 RepID=A0A1I0DS66_9ACTN|nr:fructuronate reductase [Geodermatophilus poikilotrophus]